MKIQLGTYGAPKMLKAMVDRYTERFGNYVKDRMQREIVVLEAELWSERIRSDSRPDYVFEIEADIATLRKHLVRMERGNDARFRDAF
jgi:hypothetical protein